MMVFKRISGLFLMIMGLSIIATWIMLFFDDEIPGMHEELFSFIFHWASELFLAISGIIVGLHLLGKEKWPLKALFFILGLAVCSTYHATSYYLFKNYNISFVVFIGFFLVISLVLLITGLRIIKQEKNGFMILFGLFSLGVMIYLILNLAGQFGQDGEWAAFVNMIFLILVGLFYSWKLIWNRGGWF